MMKPLSTSVYTFSKLIEGGFLYVDKTAGLYQLIRPAFGQYFLSRPRRFGKSLTISTLKSIFLGERELFDGLAIADADYDWQTYPVIHLDMGATASGTVDELQTNLVRQVRQAARKYNKTVTAALGYQAFEDLILELAQSHGKIVILIDEYDKPLLGHLGQKSAGDIQHVLKEFYAVIKTTEAQQRFVLLTGVSKFSKVSVFSDLNNLTDLTMSRHTATLLGYTQAELEANFPDYIDRLAEDQDESRGAILDKLRRWYNGYRFEEDAETVYNPVSVMKCFQELKFKNYWFETGTPSFLINLLRHSPVDLGDLTVPETAFSAYEPDRLEPLPLLVQTGYLTLQGCDSSGAGNQYRLGYPNFEIEQSFNYWLARDFSALGDQDLNSAVRRMLAALEDARIDDMLEHLKVFFAQIPNDITLRHEKYYQTIFFTVFRLLGTAVEAETRTNIGRIDAVVRTGTHIFLFEFKLHGSAREALDQIHEKGYAFPYRDESRPVTCIGVAFDETTRNLAGWLVEVP